MGYLANFIVYFCAMIGIIILALFVYKKFNVGNAGVKNRNLCIEDALSLSARKTLYVIRNGNERFLIAADFERTTLISKLGESDDIEENIPHNVNSRYTPRADLSDYAVNMQDNVAPLRKPIMREIKNKLQF